MSWRDSFSDEQGRCVLYEEAGNLGVQPISVVVPSDRRWLVLAVQFGLSTVTTPGGRRARLEFLAEGSLLWRSDSPVLQTVGQSRTYSFLPTKRERASFLSGDILLGLPRWLIGNEGATVRCAATGMGFDDAFDSLRVWVQEWLCRV